MAVAHKRSQCIVSFELAVNWLGWFGTASWLENALHSESIWQSETYSLKKIGHYWFKMRALYKEVALPCSQLFWSLFFTTAVNRWVVDYSYPTPGNLNLQNLQTWFHLPFDFMAGKLRLIRWNGAVSITLICWFHLLSGKLSIGLSNPSPEPIMHQYAASHGKHSTRRHMNN